MNAPSSSSPSFFGKKHKYNAGVMSSIHPSVNQIYPSRDKEGMETYPGQPPRCINGLQNVTTRDARRLLKTGRTSYVLSLTKAFSEIIYSSLTGLQLIIKKSNLKVNFLML